MLRGGERKVKQVLLNLLSNALKFTPEGGRIDVSAGLHDDIAEIAVTDTGIGIAPEDQSVWNSSRRLFRGSVASRSSGSRVPSANARKRTC